MNTTVSMYIDRDGKLNVVHEQHISLFNLLRSLGLKSCPEGMLVWTTTNVVPGNYNVSYTLNGNFVTTTVQIKDPAPDIQVKIPKVEKLRKGPDREQRRQWRTDSKKLSRNTGRVTGRR